MGDVNVLKEIFLVLYKKGFSMFRKMIGYYINDRVLHIIYAMRENYA